MRWEIGFEQWQTEHIFGKKYFVYQAGLYYNEIFHKIQSHKTVDPC